MQLDNAADLQGKGVEDNVATKVTNKQVAKYRH